MRVSVGTVDAERRDGGMAVRGVLVTLLVGVTVLTRADKHTDRLVRDVLRNYNRHVRPRHSETMNVTYVKVGISLISIDYVDLKNQMLGTHLWVHQEWNDYTLKWNPEDYGNITYFKVDAKSVWIPDLVIYNSADGNFTMYRGSRHPKVTVNHTGVLHFVTPSILKSLCDMDVENFPFDHQRCFLKIGSWTHDITQVDIYPHQLNYTHPDYYVKDAMDRHQYSSNPEWDLVADAAQKYVPSYPCCPDTPFPDIKYFMLLRRRPLFYVINLVVPCVAICSVAILVFYIPAKSCEKITMAITVLNSLIVFQLLVVDITPPTSMGIPLIGKYILFTMVLMTSSIGMTVIVINIHFASPISRQMPPWIRELFLHMLPRILLMTPPQTTATPTRQELAKRREARSDADGEDAAEAFHRRSLRRGRRQGMQDCTYDNVRALPGHVLRTMIGVSAIADSLKKAEDFKKHWEDWQYVARVVDRLFLFLFVSACFLGTMGTILQASSHYDMRPGLEDTNSSVPLNVFY